MKKLLLSSLLFSFGLFAQEKESYCSISIGTDVKNSIVGSKPTGNNPALDLVMNINAVSCDFEISAGYEHFQAIGFSRYSADFGFHNQRYIPIGNKEFDFTAVPSIGFSMIQRFNGIDHYASNGDFIYSRSSHLAAQVNLSLRTKLSDKILLDWTIQAITRPDLQYLYPTDDPKFIVFSNYLKLHYIIN